MDTRDLVALSILLAGFAPYLSDAINADHVYRGVWPPCNSRTSPSARWWTCTSAVRCAGGDPAPLRLAGDPLNAFIKDKAGL